MFKRIWLSITSLANQAHAPLSRYLSTSDEKAVTILSQRVKMILLCVMVFILAAAVRLLYLEDRFTETQHGTSFLTIIVKPYRQDAIQILEDRSFFAPKPREDAGENRLLLHPPGYALLLLAIYGAEEPSDSFARLRLLQMAFDALASVMMLLIAAELLPLWASVLGAILVALSPHLALYSLYLSPDSLAVFPILVAVHLIVKARRRPNVGIIVLAGVMIGLSCWMRSNALFLTVFIAGAMFILFERGKRLRYAAILVAATVVTISPITLRNWILSGRFVPLSLGAGVTLMEGIGDYDKEGRFDMPATDAAVARREAEWFNQPAYEQSLWEPDGIDRERSRFSKALKVIGSNPGWFLGVMIRRAGFMLRYNQADAGGWPFDTSQAAYLSAEPPFKHRVTKTDDLQIVEQPSNQELFSDGIKAPVAQMLFEPDHQTLHLVGDGAAFENQLISRPLTVDKDSDLILEIEFNLIQGDAAMKITSVDIRDTLTSVGLAAAADEHRLLMKYRRKALAKSASSAVEAEAVNASTSLEFASGPRNQVRIAISNNGRPDSTMELKRLTLRKAGSTPGLWTRYPRMLIRVLQKNIFLSARMLPLIALGIVLLALARRWSALLVLLVVPSYYLVVQSALHTEYRYILAIHFFLLVISAVAIAFILAGVGRGVRLAFLRVTDQRSRL